LLVAHYGKSLKLVIVNTSAGENLQLHVSEITCRMLYNLYRCVLLGDFAFWQGKESRGPENEIG
jgi:hypothetical protein